LTSLRQKTISGLTWSFLDNSFNQVIQFVVGIILARLLNPKDFGLIGMIMIFFAVSTSLIDSGFGDALVRKKNCSADDYNTAFHFNLLIGILLFLLLFFTAPIIADFYSEKQLKNIIRVLSLSTIITAFGIVQSADLVKKIDFKTRTKISLISNLSSSIIAIIMAYKGFGVWSLVARQFLTNLIGTSTLWFYNKWLPKLRFSIKSFKELFSFGSNMLVAGLIDRIFNNIYYVIIGKYFSPQTLGYYTRAASFANLPSLSIDYVIQRVSYPVLITINDDNERLKAVFKKLVKTTMLITLVFMIGLASLAEPLILTLIGDKWRPSIQFLQLLSFSLILYPLQSLNLNILLIKGRSDIYLRMGIIKKILIIPVILLGIFNSIEMMIIGMIIHSLITYLIISNYSGNFLDYRIVDQIKDILPAFIIAGLNGILILVISNFLTLPHSISLFILLIISFTFIIAACELIKLDSYIEIKEIIISRIN